MKKIGKLTTTLIMGIFLSLQLSAADYKLNKAESKVKWKGKKVTGEHHGTIEIKSGNLNIEDFKIKGGTVQIDMNSIVNEDLTNESMNKKLVGHLKLDDFFSVEKFPASELKINNVKHKAGNEYTVNAGLTIKGITSEIEFDVNLAFSGKSLKAEGIMEVDRTLYDIRFRSGKFFPGLGDNLIYDKFTLNFSIVATAGSDTVMLQSD